MKNFKKFWKFGLDFEGGALKSCFSLILGDPRRSQVLPGAPRRSPGAPKAAKGLPLYMLDSRFAVCQQTVPFFPVDINSLFNELDFEFFSNFLHDC